MMTGIENYFFVLLIAFSFGLIFYFSQHPEFMTSLLGETGNLLLYGLQRLRFTVCYGFRMAGLELKSLFLRSSSIDEQRKLLSQKGQNLRRFKRNTDMAYNSYQKRMHHLRILK